MNGKESFSVIGCQCDCNDGYSGSLCEHTIPTEVDDTCIDAEICTETGQICNADNKCGCDTENGFIQDEFLPSTTYGECVGPVPSCIIDRVAHGRTKI